MGASFSQLGHGISNTFGHFDPNATEGAGVIDELGNEIPDAMHGLSESQKRNRMLLRFGGAGLQGASQHGQQQGQPNPYGDFSQYWRQ